jgi:ribonuclease HI
MHTLFLRQLQQEIDEEVIVQVKREDCKFISPTFLVPKRGGEWRKVIDCREVNKYIRDQTFIMEDHRTARMLIEQGDYATSIDIKEAYHHIPVAIEFRPYLSFVYAGRYYQYRGMPFGVKHAPRIFTLIMRAAMREIRVRWDERSVQYLDDLLFLGKEKGKLERETAEIADFLQQLGWCVNWKKSNMIANQRFVFLGIEWNTVGMTLQIDRQRNTLLKRQVKQWIRWATTGKTRTVRKVAKLIGQLSQSRVQHTRASLYLSRLNRMKTRAVIQRGWNSAVRLTPWILKDLIWWRTQLRINRPTTIRIEGTVVTIYTDASPQGWGGWMETNDLKHLWVTHGVWRVRQEHSSNYLEMMAVYLVLKYFIHMGRFVGIHKIHLRTDNTTVLYDVNRKRGASTLLHPLKMIMELLENHSLHMTASHIPGVSNVTADKLSRLARSGDYALNRRIYNQGLRHLGVQVDIDLFADKRN